MRVFITRRMNLWLSILETDVCFMHIQILHIVNTSLQLQLFTVVLFYTLLSGTVWVFKWMSYIVLPILGLLKKPSNRRDNEII